MILWGLIVGAMLGLAAADFEQFGMILGAALGAGAGWSLRKAVRAEVAAMLAAQGAALIDPAGQAAEPRVPAAESFPVRIVDQASPVEPPAEPPAEPMAPPPAREAIAAEPGLIERGLAAARAWLLGGNSIVRMGLVVLFIGLAFLARWAAGPGCCRSSCALPSSLPPGSPCSRSGSTGARRVPLSRLRCRAGGSRCFT